MTTAAQEEFNDFLEKNTARDTLHPEDRNDKELRPTRDNDDDDLSEEEAFRNSQIDAAMRTTTGPSELKLPPASFDNGRTTGVKGVIADARSYETARRSKWKSRMQNARQSLFGMDGLTGAVTTTTTITGGGRRGGGGGGSSSSDSESDAQSNSEGGDEEAFLQQWRESRRKELESEASRSIRNRRTSPSVRVYGRMDDVDALGYLDAIEKVSRGTVVVVFVYDHECEVSAAIEAALLPLVRAHNTVHFVKIHYDDIEFDNAAVPALLGYRNQGDLFANLTGLIEMIPDDDNVGSETLKALLRTHGVL